MYVCMQYSRCPRIVNKYVQMELFVQRDLYLSESLVNGFKRSKVELQMGMLDALSWRPNVLCRGTNLR